MGMLRCAAAFLVAVLVWLPALATSHPQQTVVRLDGSITVMTRNLYLGTDLFPVFDAVLPPPWGTGGTPAAVARAAYEARAKVDASDFRVRARGFAAEIAQHRPHAIGLQEVALWRTGPHEPEAVGVPNATRVDYDFLALLLDALADAGQAYDPVVVVEEGDFEWPSQGPGGQVRDVRITLRDAILVRASDDLGVVRSGRGHFRSQLAMPGLGHTVPFTRGYGWVDLRRGAQRLRFINTHLEVGNAKIGHDQALEVLAGPAQVEQPTIIVCDCNSDPARPWRSLAYRAFLRGGFVDQWLTVAGGGPGHTCCHAQTLRHSDPVTMDHRVDFVFARAEAPVAASRAQLLGGPAVRRDGDARHPSDHAGLVVRLRTTSS